jgi:hypothetical protein
MTLFMTDFEKYEREMKQVVIDGEVARRRDQDDLICIVEMLRMTRIPLATALGKDYFVHNSIRKNFIS